MLNNVGGDHETTTLTVEFSVYSCRKIDLVNNNQKRKNNLNVKKLGELSKFIPQL